MRKAPPEIDDRDDAELFRAAIGADRGKVRALPGAAGTYRGLAIAEEAGVEGQLVLARLAPIGNIVVP